MSRSFLFSFSVFFGVFTVLFFLFQVLSVDSVLTMIGQSSSEDTKKAISSQFHLDLPIWQRYSIQLNDASPISIHSENPTSKIYFDPENYSGVRLLQIGSYGWYLKWMYFGRSFQNYEIVTTLLKDRLLVTFVLAMMSILIASVFGILLGMVASAYQNRWQDHLILSFSTWGVSAPSFFTAILLALVFGYYWSDYTGLSFKGSLIAYDDRGESYICYQNMILPIAALSWRPFAMITLLMRNSMLDTLKEDFIRTAFAKGLSPARVFWKHALRHAINPIITSISGWFGSLLAGAYFIEMIFGLKGLGSLTVQAIMKLDIPVVMGASIYISGIFIAISLGVDTLYRWIDPRIKS